MAIGFVAKGAIARTATAGVTPAFGQATTAGNFLIARVAAQSTSTGITGADITCSDATWSTGFVSGTITTGTNTSMSGIFYKLNCSAGETAPTFTMTGGNNAEADLTEWSGSVVLDQTSFGVGFGSNTVHVANPDGANGYLAIVAFGHIVSKSATMTYADGWTPTGGTIHAAQGDGATKALVHCWFSDDIMASHSTADTELITVTPSTGSLNGSAAVMVTFKPVSAAAPDLLVANFGALTRASTW